MMGVILNDWNDDGCGCLEFCAGGVLLPPPVPAPSPPAPLPLLSGALGERGVECSRRGFWLLGALEGVEELGFEGFCKDVKDGCWGL